VNSWTRLCIVAAAVITLTAPATAQKVQTEIDSHYDFVRLKTFALTPLNPKDVLNKRPEIVNELKKELVSELEKAGYREDEVHPDFLVSFTADQQKYRSSYTESATGVNAESQTYNSDYATRTLILDLVDPGTKKPFWHATASDQYSLGTMEKFIPKAVKKTVEEFRKEAHKRK